MTREKLFSMQVGDTWDPLNERRCNNLMVGNAHELRKGKEETMCLEKN